MDLAGLAGGPTRPPTYSLDEEERDELREILSRADLPALTK